MTRMRGRPVAHALVVLTLGACSVGSDPGGGGGPGSGTSDGGGGDGGGGGPVWVDASIGSGGANDCLPRVTSPPAGYHNTGKNCMDSCHNHGFTLAGTVYTGANNNSGYAGATVTVIGANGVTHDVVVRADGNFWTSEAIAFPALVKVSACPYETRMEATVANGRCNTAACHAQLGGAAGQIHLP